MGRTLRYLGILLLAGSIWALLAGAAGWLEPGLASSLARPAAVGGAACLGLGFLVGLLGRMRRPAGRARCKRCGAPIDRGQTLCLDHLLQTVKDYRDQSSGIEMEPPGRRAARR